MTNQLENKDNRVMEYNNKRIILYFILLILALVVAWVISNVVFAGKIDERPYFSDNSLFLRASTGVLIGIEAELWEMARKYEINYERFYGLAYCESRLNPNAEGKAGEIGIFQFLPSTFSSYATKYKKVGFSIHNTNHQIELAAQMLTNGKASEWTCLY